MMKQWLKKHLTTVILTAILLVGLGMLLYPSLADYWNSFHQSRAIMSYAEQVASMDTEEHERILESARAYNADLTERGTIWKMTDEEEAAYNAELSFNSKGNMGYINIDKIDVTLPIYHGTSESVLQTSIGHLAGTSLPVGGEGTHCVLSGHRGLPSARLFSDLDRLVVGDTWTISILNETLTYEVDQIRIVEPTDLSDLQIVPGEDYCTLLTCTPYGINTQRLLVRGHRIANADGEANVVAEAIQIEPNYIAILIGACLVLILLLILLVTTSCRLHRGSDFYLTYCKEKGLEQDNYKEVLAMADLREARNYDGAAGTGRQGRRQRKGK